MRLEGKTALITGAGSGQGREIAQRFAQEGARVIATDLLGDTAEETVTEIDGALALELDVTSQASIDEALETIAAEVGPFDVLVNNAGVTITGRVEDLTEELWDRQIATNLKSIFLMSKAAWRVLVDNGGGSIINTASIYGIWAAENDAAYCTSKAGVIMLTKCMALDGAKAKIRVNCICPGFIETPMIQGYFADQPDPAASRDFATSIHPLGRLGQPRDIADGFVYLSSDEASWVTGTPLVIDGGLVSGIWGG